MRYAVRSDQTQRIFGGYNVLCFGDWCDRTHGVEHPNQAGQLELATRLASVPFLESERRLKGETGALGLRVELRKINLQSENRR